MKTAFTQTKKLSKYYETLKNYKTVLWDVDGTLISNSLSCHYWSWRQAFKKYGIDPNIINAKDMGIYIGGIFKKYNIHECMQEALYKEKNRIFSEQVYEPNTDAINFINNNNIDFFIISNASKTSINNIIDGFNEQSKCFNRDLFIDKNKFIDILTREDVEDKKPSIDFWYLLNEKHTLKEPICYVGDHHTDKEFAEKCCIDFFKV
jgi:phosphoglycolate phosphatase-like HAD superfamily hydrolase